MGWLKCLPVYIYASRAFSWCQVWTAKGLTSPPTLRCFYLPSKWFRRQSVLLDKEASHRGLKTKVNSQPIPHLSDHPTSPRATNSAALLVCTDLVCIMNSRNAQERRGSILITELCLVIMNIKTFHYKPQTIIVGHIETACGIFCVRENSCYIFII